VSECDRIERVEKEEERERKVERDIIIYIYEIIYIIN